MNKTTRFDAVDYLQDEQDIAIYWEEAAKQAHAENDTGILLDAISVAAKARGMMQTAKDAGLSRESLYKALAHDAKPRFETISKVLGALGVQMSFTPISDSVASKSATSI